MVKEEVSFSREELQILISRFETCRKYVVNEHWISAYQCVIDALDRLDATYARSEIRFTTEVVSK